MILVINLNILYLALLTLKNQNGDIKTSCRIFISEKARSKSGENTMDEIYAWNKPDFHFFIPVCFNCYSCSFSDFASHSCIRLCP